jgi:hypothetical protein
MLPLIRFTAMSHSFLDTAVRPTGLVSLEELFSAVLFQMDEAKLGGQKRELEGSEQTEDGSQRMRKRRRGCRLSLLWDEEWKGASI